MIRTLSEYLPEHPFFAGLEQRMMDLVVGCAQNVHFAQGEVLFRTGEPANTFYVIRSGRVALEVNDPRRGGLLIATLQEGEVAGWSWLVEPHRWMFDARATAPIQAVSIDGACLRGKCAEDPALGFALMQRVAQVMYDRLQEARLRLLDVYGTPA
jgi:CRP-like cAMP-binding protein